MQSENVILNLARYAQLLPRQDSSPPTGEQILERTIIEAYPNDPDAVNLVLKSVEKFWL